MSPRLLKQRHPKIARRSLIKRFWLIILLLLGVLAYSIPQAFFYYSRHVRYPIRENLTINVAPITIQQHKQPIAKGARFGMLEFVGAYELTSEDGNFGGISSMIWQAGKLHMLSDKSVMFSSIPQFNEEGTLTGFDQVRSYELFNTLGNPLRYPWNDAEAMVKQAGGRVLMSFERHHRLDMYSLKDGEYIKNVGYPEEIVKHLSVNSGIEAITEYQPQTMLGISEAAWVRNQESEHKDELRAWIITPHHATPVFYKSHNAFSPTELVTIGDGTIISLERFADMPVGGLQTRLAAFSASDIRSEGTINPQTLVLFDESSGTDNLEAMAFVRKSRKDQYLLVMSDNNFLPPLQRTVLLQFRLAFVP